MVAPIDVYQRQGFTIILLVLLPILLNQLHRMLAQEQQQYQEERATNLGLLVNQQVKTAFDHLKTLGETYLLLDQAQRETYLQAKAQEAPYLQLGIMNAEGLLRTTDQQTMTASQLFALQPLLQGKKVLAKDNVNSQETVSYTHLGQWNGRRIVLPCLANIGGYPAGDKGANGYG